MNPLPETLKQGIDDFVLHGLIPGDFLRSCLQNEFVESVLRADDTSRQYFREIAFYIYEYVPRECWGSPEKFVAWRKMKNEQRVAAKEGEK